MSVLYPFALLISTGIIWFHVGFIAAGMLFLGGILSWIGSYSALSALIYSRGKKRLLVPIIQTCIAVGGYFILINANFKLGLFGYQIENYEFAYFSLVMGILMAVTTSPDQLEINAQQ